jgi:acyl carrier protein
MKNEFLREDIRIKTLEILKDFTLNDEIYEDSTLSDIEVDDFMVTELILRLESELDITINTDEIRSYSDFLDLTVNETVDKIFDLLY